MNKKDKKKRFLELFKEVLTLQETIPDAFLRTRIEVITKGLENETLDYESGMSYILINAKKAKRLESMAVWSKVLKAFREYWKDVK